MGIDGTYLATDPGGHILHCLTCCGCPNDGYAILEGGGTSYSIKYQLDGTGNDLMYDLAYAEQSRVGDRAFNELIIATGTLVGNELQTTSLCFTPTVNNAAGETICHTAPTPPPSSAPTSSSPTSASTEASPSTALEPTSP